MEVAMGMMRKLTKETGWMDGYGFPGVSFIVFQFPV